MANKKGQDLSIGTLILIVLGIIVLVLLVLGFSMGWGSMWEKINIFGGSSSMDSIITSCNVAATTTSGQYSYCQDFKKTKVNGQTEYLNCQDTRITSSLDKKLDCPEGYKTASESSSTYCKTLQLDSKYTTATKVNGINCAVINQADKAERDAAQKQCITACTALPKPSSPLTATDLTTQQGVCCTPRPVSTTADIKLTCKEIGTTCTMTSTGSGFDCNSVSCPTA